MAEEEAETQGYTETPVATTTIGEVLSSVIEEKKEKKKTEEETNVVSLLPEMEKNALDELKKLLIENELTDTAPRRRRRENVNPTVPTESVDTDLVSGIVVTASVDDDGAKTVEAIEETVKTAPLAESPALEPETVSIWGVPLLADEKSDVILLKFLRARDFKVKDAFTMLKNTIEWRKNFNIEALLEEDLGTDLDKVVYISGVDKEGHPVCYNVYGEFKNKGLYESTFGEKPEKFLRWRVQFLERTIRKDLDFKQNGVCRFVQVNDLKGSPGPFQRELKVATDQAVEVLQDNYPEFVAKQIFINVPWWYLAFYTMISPFFTQRTKSKFVFAGPSKSAETLFKYIAPEQIPVQYGGLSKDGELEFTTADIAAQEIIKPSSKSTIEIPVSEPCTLVWEARVIGWDVSYEAEFVPNAACGYTIIIQKPRKAAMSDETVLCGSYKAVEAGKVVLTFDNSASLKKKKLLYRSKTKPSA